MKKLIMLTAFISLANGNAFCQTDNDNIKRTINTMFDAMRKGDSTQLRSVFAKEIIFQGVAVQNGENVLKTENSEGFIKAVGTPHKAMWDERITWGDIKVDGPLASVWANYKFYFGPQFSHCGIDYFQLLKTSSGWKIIYISDTRRKDNCPE